MNARYSLLPFDKIYANVAGNFNKLPCALQPGMAIIFPVVLFCEAQQRSKEIMEEGEFPALKDSLFPKRSVFTSLNSDKEIST